MFRFGPVRRVDAKDIDPGFNQFLQNVLRTIGWPAPVWQRFLFGWGGCAAAYRLRATNYTERLTLLGFSSTKKLLEIAVS